MQQKSKHFWVLRYLREVLLHAGPRASLTVHPLELHERGLVTAALPELGVVQKLWLARGAEVQVGPFFVLTCPGHVTAALVVVQRLSSARGAEVQAGPFDCV